MVTGMWTL